jgi:hypothetical protein
MKNKDQIKKTITELRKALDRHEELIRSFRLHIEHLISTTQNMKLEEEADLPEIELKYKGLGYTPEFRECVASYVNTLTVKTNMSKSRATRVLGKALKMKPGTLYSWLPPRQS